MSDFEYKEQSWSTQLIQSNLTTYLPVSLSGMPCQAEKYQSLGKALECEEKFQKYLEPTIFETKLFRENFFLGTLISAVTKLF